MEFNVWNFLLVRFRQSPVTSSKNALKRFQSQAKFSKSNQCHVKKMPWERNHQKSLLKSFEITFNPALSLKNVSKVR